MSQSPVIQPAIVIRTVVYTRYVDDVIVGWKDVSISDDSSVVQRDLDKKQEEKKIQENQIFIQLDIQKAFLQNL
jgi:hypothetical protein